MKLRGVFFSGPWSPPWRGFLWSPGSAPARYLRHFDATMALSRENWVTWLGPGTLFSSLRRNNGALARELGHLARLGRVIYATSTQQWRSRWRTGPLGWARTRYLRHFDATMALSLENRTTWLGSDTLFTSLRRDKGALARELSHLARLGHVIYVTSRAGSPCSHGTRAPGPGKVAQFSRTGPPVRRILDTVDGNSAKVANGTYFSTFFVQKSSFRVRHPRSRPGQGLFWLLFTALRRSRV